MPVKGFSGIVSTHCRSGCCGVANAVDESEVLGGPVGEVAGVAASAQTRASQRRWRPPSPTPLPRSSIASAVRPYGVSPHCSRRGGIIAHSDSPVVRTRLSLLSYACAS